MEDKSWRDTLEKRTEQAEFEPFVSVEDAATAKHATITPSMLQSRQANTPRPSMAYLSMSMTYCKRGE